MEKYTAVHSFSDLAQFGIKPLTGESCAFSMRMLCDVSEDGKELLADFFGMPNIQLEKNWNSYVGEEKAIGSILLVRELVPQLAQFAFFRKGALAVAITSGEVIGVWTKERISAYKRLIEDNPGCGYLLRMNYAANSAAPMVGSRNVHAFSGRTT